jgi:hypothetical protein
MALRTTSLTSVMSLDRNEWNLTGTRTLVTLSNHSCRHELHCRFWSVFKPHDADMHSNSSWSLIISRLNGALTSEFINLCPPTSKAGVNTHTLDWTLISMNSWPYQKKYRQKFIDIEVEAKACYLKAILAVLEEQSRG